MYLPHFAMKLTILMVNKVAKHLDVGIVLFKPNLS